MLQGLLCFLALICFCALWNDEDDTGNDGAFFLLEHFIDKKDHNDGK